MNAFNNWDCAVHFACDLVGYRRLVFLLCLSPLASVLYTAIASGNFDEVIPGVLYRPAQPDAAEIKYIVENFGVKSTLNLRGETKGDWYREESAAAQRANVQLIDFPISSGHTLSKTDLEKSIAILNGAPKPMLEHCEHSADRTGLVSAIFVKLTGSGSWLAKLQLSPYYGHVPLPGIGRFAMQES